MTCRESGLLVAPTPSSTDRTRSFVTESSLPIERRGHVSFFLRTEFMRWLSGVLSRLTYTNHQLRRWLPSRGVSLERRETRNLREFDVIVKSLGHRCFGTYNPNFLYCPHDGKGSSKQIRGRAWLARSSREASHFTYPRTSQQRDPPAARFDDSSRGVISFYQGVCSNTEALNISNSAANEIHSHLGQVCLKECETLHWIQSLWVRARVQ